MIIGDETASVWMNSRSNMPMLFPSGTTGPNFNWTDFDGDFWTGIFGRGKKFNWKNLYKKIFGREKYGQEQIWTGKI